MAIPTSPHTVGQKATDDSGRPVICTHAGSPGAWDTDWGSLGAPAPTAQVRVLATNNHTPNQASLQALYDGQSGLDAPDTVPAEVTAAIAGSGSWNNIYLGHNVWWYKTGSNPANPWIVFGGNKSDFGANVYDTVTFK